jgi:hypothetical protein
LRTSSGEIEKSGHSVATLGPQTVEAVGISTR